MPTSAAARDIYISLLLNGIIFSEILSFSAMFIAFAMSAIDVETFVFAILQFLVSANLIGSYVPIVIVKRKIGQMTESIQQLVNESEYFVVEFKKREK